MRLDLKSTWTMLDMVLELVFLAPEDIAMK